MDSLPNSAIAMAVGLLVVIWVVLVHMMINQSPDAHLQFLLDLMGEREEQPKCSPPQGSSPCLPDDHRMVTAPLTAESATVGTKPDSPQFLGREVPLLFATSLRGRGL